MNGKFRASLFLCGCILLGLPNPASAAQCPPYLGNFHEKVAQQAAEHELIFIGVVESVEELETTGYRRKRTKYVATINVLETIKGMLTGTKQNVYFSSGWYSAGFRLDWQYLIFTSKDVIDETLSANMCSVQRLGTMDDFEVNQSREPTADQRAFLKALRDVVSGADSAE